MTSHASAHLVVLPGGRTTPVDDAVLVQRLIGGDPRAPRIMWQRFAPMVRRMLSRSLGRDANIEDLQQDVFLWLFRRVHLLRNPKALRAFIMSITSLTLRRELRRRWLGQKQRLEIRAAAAIALPVYPDPESREGLRQFCDILQRMSHDDRSAFVLRFMEGLALEDVAAALAVSKATVKRRLARARERVVRLARRDGVLADYLPGAQQDGACA